MKQIRALFVAPQCKPMTLAIENDLTSLQTLVGGSVQAIALDENGTVLWINDDGLLVGLPPNFRAPDGTLIVGNAVITGTDAAGDNVSVADAFDSALRANFDRFARRIVTYRYNVPSMQFFTSIEDMAVTGKMASATIASIDIEDVG